MNTVLNSFFQSQDVLDRVVKNKGVDAQMSLRDKLKAYADSSHSCIQFYFSSIPLYFSFYTTVWYCLLCNTNLILNT